MPPAELPSPFETEQLKFQARQLELLESIDRRLSSIGDVADLYRRVQESVLAARAFDARMRDGR